VPSTTSTTTTGNTGQVSLEDCACGDRGNKTTTDHNLSLVHVCVWYVAYNAPHSLLTLITSDLKNSQRTCCKPWLQTKGDFPKVDVYMLELVQLHWQGRYTVAAEKLLGLANSTAQSPLLPPPSLIDKAQENRRKASPASPTALRPASGCHSPQNSLGNGQ
jgi:hypothetical protein